MSKTKLETMAFNAKFGDGGLPSNKMQSVGMSFTSTSLDYMTHKREMCAEARPTGFRFGSSGYGGKKPIYVFTVRKTEEEQEIRSESVLESLSKMEKLDLVMWILDDGSVHNAHGTLHLYCNSLTDEETLFLADKIYELYHIAKPVIRHDRKKDGRSFPYLYIPRLTALEIQTDMEAFMVAHNITSLMYKAKRMYTLNDQRKLARLARLRKEEAKASRVGRNPEVGGSAPSTYDMV